jgi:hypothetical protein
VLAGQVVEVRTFSRSHSYPADPADIVLLWRDPEFLRAVGSRFGGVGEPVVEEAGDRVRVTTRRELPMDRIPSFVRRFIADATLEQTDDWPVDPAAAGDPVEGAWTVQGRMPATMSGQQQVRRTDDGCEVEVSGQIDVSAPLVASRIEGLIAEQITKLIGAQQEFAARWLAGERPDEVSAAG